MMEQTWTTKQVVTFLMAMATGLHFASVMLNTHPSFRTIDQLLNACIGHGPSSHPSPNHLEVFEQSLQPGFFEEGKSVTVSVPDRSGSMHQELMQLSDDSFITLVANLSQPELKRIKMRKDRDPARSQDL